MINETLFMAFTEPVSAPELQEILAGIEAATMGTGLVQSFVARPHLPVPGEEATPAFIGSVIIRIALADLQALGELFAAPAVDEAFDTLRERHPYKTALVNHEPLE